MYARMARCDDPADMDAQVNVLLKLATDKGYEVAATYRDVASGYAGLDERPVLKKLLKEIASGEYDAVVVRDITRLARGNAATTDAILRTLRSAGICVVTPDGEYRAHDRDDMRYLMLCATATDFEQSPLVDMRRRLRRMPRRNASAI